MKMKRFFAVFAIIAVLCTFCTVAAMADEGVAAPDGYKYLTFVITGEAGESKPFTHLVNGTPIEVKEATCTEGGYERYACAEDKCAEESLWHQVDTDALGHAWSDSTKDPEAAAYWGIVDEIPTCEHGGTATAFCTRCGEVKEVRELNPLEHDYSVEVVDVNTCKEYKSHFVCKNCGAVQTDEKGETVYNTERPQGDNASDHHTWTKPNETKKATCTSEGEQTIVCTTCGAKKVEKIKMAEHEIIVKNTQLIDCTEILVTKGCKNCGYSYTESIYGDFHQYEIGKVIKAATCTEKGEVELKCKYCPETNGTKTIDELGHDWTEWTLIDTYLDEEDKEVGVYTRDCLRPGCGYHEELVSATAPVEEPENPGASDAPEAPVETVENIYAIDAVNVVKGENSVSGTGNLIVVGTEEVGEMYARVAVVYENEAGEQILVVNVAEVKADLTFKIPSVKAPYGYTVKTVCLVAVTSDEAVEGAWADYAVCDSVVL